MSQIRVFRMIALAEGISFLTLLFIAMPMKYFIGMPEVVRVVGSIHGGLFVLYVGLLAMIHFRQRWSFMFSLYALLRLLFRLEHLCWTNNFVRKKQWRTDQEGKFFTGRFSHRSTCSLSLPISLSRSSAGALARSLSSRRRNPQGLRSAAFRCAAWPYPERLSRTPPPRVEIKMRCVSLVDLNDGAVETFILGKARGRKSGRAGRNWRR